MLQLRLVCGIVLGVALLGCFRHEVFVSSFQLLVSTVVVLLFGDICAWQVDTHPPDRVALCARAVVARN